MGAGRFGAWPHRFDPAVRRAHDEDLHAMLEAHGDWMELGSADEQKPAKPGTVEAWGRSPKNPVGGWYGRKKGLRWRFAMYVPPLMEALGLAEWSTTRVTTACEPSPHSRSETSRYNVDAARCGSLRLSPTEVSLSVSRRAARAGGREGQAGSVDRLRATPSTHARIDTDISGQTAMVPLARGRGPCGHGRRGMFADPDFGTGPRG